MNCDAYQSTLGDHVDGTLPPAAAEQLAVHLASCDRCRALTDDLRAIRSAARMLERHEPPPRTWHHIAAAVEDDRRTRPFGWVAWRPLAAAAAVVIVAVGTWFAAPPPAPLTPGDAAAISDTVTFDIQTAEARYESEIAGLEQITTAGGNELDPMTAEILKTNLTVIDSAIGESRAALETEPASDVAQQRLFAALNSKLALLQDTITLINEMRQGEQNP